MKLKPWFSMLLLAGLVQALPVDAAKPAWVEGKPGGKPVKEMKAQMEHKAEEGKAYREQKEHKVEEEKERKEHKAREEMEKRAQDRQEAKGGKPDLSGKKDDQEMKELDKGSEQGQEARQKRKKWWQFW